MIKILLPKKVFAGLTLLALSAMSLGGCGFQPLYGNQGTQAIDASDELKRVYVANIPTRFGQTMRLALQKDMAGDGPEKPDGYTLKVNGSASFEAVDIHLDNTSGRSRLVGRAQWKLYSVEEQPKLLAQGFARTLDGYNPNIQQYFAQSLNDETALKRVSENLAHDITQQVAIWLKANISLGPDKTTPRRYLDVDEMQDGHSGRYRFLDSDGFPAMATGRMQRSYSTQQLEDTQP